MKVFESENRDVFCCLYFSVVLSTHISRILIYLMSVLNVGWYWVHGLVQSSYPSLWCWTTREDHWCLPGPVSLVWSRQTEIVSSLDQTSWYWTTTSTCLQMVSRFVISKDQMSLWYPVSREGFLLPPIFKEKLLAWYQHGYLRAVQSRNSQESIQYFLSSSSCHLGIKHTIYLQTNWSFMAAGRSSTLIPVSLEMTSGFMIFVECLLYGGFQRMREEITSFLS